MYVQDLFLIGIGVHDWRQSEDIAYTCITNWGMCFIVAELARITTSGVLFRYFFLDQGVAKDHDPCLCS